MCDLGLHPKKALPVTLTKIVRYFKGLWFSSTRNSTFSVFTVFANFTHCSKSWFFVQKFNFDFPRKLSIFWGVKNSWKCCGFGLFSCWQLWFHEKTCQKNLGEKLVKMFCQNWIFGQKFDFSNSVCWLQWFLKPFTTWIPTILASTLRSFAYFSWRHGPVQCRFNFPWNGKNHHIDCYLPSTSWTSAHREKKILDYYLPCSCIW